MTCGHTTPRIRIFTTLQSLQRKCLFGNAFIMSVLKLCYGVGEPTDVKAQQTDQEPPDSFIHPWTSFLPVAKSIEKKKIPKDGTRRDKRSSPDKRVNVLMLIFLIYSQSCNFRLFLFHPGASPPYVVSCSVELAFWRDAFVFYLVMKPR